jgi:hypothetical protein
MICVKIKVSAILYFSNKIAANHTILRQRIDFKRFEQLGGTSSHFHKRDETKIRYLHITKE